MRKAPQRKTVEVNYLTFGGLGRYRYKSEDGNDEFYYVARTKTDEFSFEEVDYSEWLNYVPQFGNLSAIELPRRALLAALRRCLRGEDFGTVEGDFGTIVKQGGRIYYTAPCGRSLSITTKNAESLVEELKALPLSPLKVD